MWTRSTKTILLAATLLLILGALPDAAAAQTPTPWSTRVVTGPPGLPELLAEIRRPAYRPEIHEIAVPDTVEVGSEVLFSASTNVEAAPLPLVARWDFGDGTTARGLFTRHRYTEPGIHRVTFRLSGRGDEAVATAALTVVEPGARR